ncbi:MAG: hypothetical protein GY696_39575 [Gammaproteobacteria bacterium]|nr:hypothetical protein [Gammaproteobacteria bacterium]
MEIITCVYRSPATLYSQAQLPTTVISKKMAVARTVSSSQPQLYIARINREDSDGAAVAGQLLSRGCRPTSCPGSCQ